jgi:hypothetical protein
MREHEFQEVLTAVLAEFPELDPVTRLQVEQTVRTHLHAQALGIPVERVAAFTEDELLEAYSDHFRVAARELIEFGHTDMIRFERPDDEEET